MSAAAADSEEEEGGNMYVPPADDEAAAAPATHATETFKSFRRQKRSVAEPLREPKFDRAPYPPFIQKTPFPPR